MAHLIFTYNIRLLSVAKYRFDTVQVFTTYKEDDNEVTNNQHITSNMSEKNEISFYIQKPSGPSETLTSLDKYIDESNRQSLLPRTENYLRNRIST
jgi:hypothetical protein